MKIVTSGSAFLDIDAYAGCIAYAELLNLQGIKAMAFSSAPLNQSITPTIRQWQAPLETDYQASSDDSFIIVDVSDPHFLDQVVDLARVEEVIDHHVGHQPFWRDRIGSKSAIEFIGAAATQIYERWVRAAMLQQMNQTSARLLACAILDNTLDFRAAITTARDHQAYQALLPIAGLPDSWTADYFEECQASILQTIDQAVIHDTKMIRFRNLDAHEVAFGQLVLWDAKEVASHYRKIVEEVLAVRSEDWFMNAVSISDGHSIFLASNGRVAAWAEQVLGVRFSDGLAIADRLWLRKEIVKQDGSYEGGRI